MLITVFMLLLCQSDSCRSWTLRVHDDLIRDMAGAYLLPGLPGLPGLERAAGAAARRVGMARQLDALRAKGTPALATAAIATPGAHHGGAVASAQTRARTGEAPPRAI
jgi:hypothetical protein